MSTIGTRLREYLQRRNLTQEEFSRLTKISKQTINNVVGDKTAPSGDVLIRMSAEYRDLSLNWLVSGEGNMFVFENDEIGGKTNAFVNFTKDSLIALLAERNKVIDTQHGIIETLKETVAYQRQLLANYTGKQRKTTSG